MTKDATVSSMLAAKDAAPAKPEAEGETASSEETGGEDSSGGKVQGKRYYDLDPTRFGDWELNGRCIDF